MVESNQSQPLAYPPEYLAKLGPGTELDKLVHSVVFKKKLTAARPPKYSQNLALLLPAMELYPFGVGRSQPGDVFYSDERQYWAGHVDYEAVFTSSSPALAAAKAVVFLAQLIDNKPKQPTEPDAGE